MAAIDKTYTDKNGLIEVIDWCRKVGKCKLENGYTFRPLNFVYGYNELDDNYRPIREQDTYIVWNTPKWFDRWLWLNCPIDFIKDNLICFPKIFNGFCIKPVFINREDFKSFQQIRIIHIFLRHTRFLLISTTSTSPRTIPSMVLRFMRISTARFHLSPTCHQIS